MDGAAPFGVEALAESILLLRFGAGIDAAVNARVHEAAAILRAAGLPGVVDLVPAYATLGVCFRPDVWADGEHGLPWQHLADAVRAVFVAPPVARATGKQGGVIEIPVCYGGAFGTDLAEVAAHCGLAAEEVVARHAGADYRVAMIGFAPGFAYLLGLDRRLHTPRRATPRARVPRGAVAIGGAQTGVYPSQLPGGWQVIGRTPLRLFDAASEPPCVLWAGANVRFRAIEADEFTELDIGTPG